jgi:hypothetical protein
MTSLSRRGQTLNLGTPCLDRLTIAHELVHALGFHLFIPLSTTGQLINLGTRCLNNRLVIAHEFMHALGFHHGTNRPDQFIRVNFQNIRSGELLFI